MNVVMIEEPSTELTVQDRAALALSSGKTRLALFDMALRSRHLIEVKNKAARDEVHSAAMALAGARIAIAKTGKAARDDATKFSKAVIAEEASLISITQPEETRLLALRDGWDTVVAAEKAAKEAAEAARIAGIVSRITTIKEYAALAAGCRTAARVDELLTKLSLFSLVDFEEFTDEASAAHLDSVNRVLAIFDEKTAQEAEQARIKAEQAEAAAKLAVDRAEFEAAQAAAKAKADEAAALLDQQRADLAADAKRQSDTLAAQHAAQVAEQQRALQVAKQEQDQRDTEAAAERQKFAEEKAAFEAQVAEAKRLTEQAEQDRLDALAFEAQSELDAQNSIPTQATETPIEQAELASPDIKTVAESGTGIVDAEINPNDVLVLTGEKVIIPLIPIHPNAETLISVIAGHFEVTSETAAEWLDTTDFNHYY